MTQSARVESTEALQALKDALAKFGVAAQGALGSADTEIQRTLDWLGDQAKFWRAQVDRRREEVTRTKAELMARRWSSDKSGSRGATEQELAYEEARRRLAEAEAKVEAVRRWQRRLPEVIKEYEGPARQLAGMVESDLRHSLAILDSKIAALEAYAALTAPEGTAAVPATTVASGGCEPPVNERTGGSRPPLAEKEGEPA